MSIAYFLIKKHREEREREREAELWATTPYVVCEHNCYDCRINAKNTYDICNDFEKEDLWLHCGHYCYDCPKDIFDSCHYSLKGVYNKYSNPIPFKKPPKIILP
ncbi:MAG: hypothetical protein IJG50_08700 [Clostridia bacterium]|nr:hypothetical protein [Clostridia bacterium]